MKNKTAYLILMIAVIFIVIGINRGEAEVVLTKAVQICLECIGIG
nr:CD1871A family CXXC motif-containing protein [Velocimicrobium porci]